MAKLGWHALLNTNCDAHSEGTFSSFRRLSTRRHYTTVYHVKVNGMVERFHRPLKIALRAHSNPTSVMHCHWSYWVAVMP